MITDPVLKNKIVITHGILMVFVWLIAVPFGMMANMYARKKNKTWGVKIHMVTMTTAAFLPFTISAILAFTAAGKVNLKPHSLLGTLLTVGAWSQVMIGVTNHLLFRYKLKNGCLPKSRPWNNYVHIWLGRILMTMALVNIPLGLKIKRVGLPVFIVYAIYVALLAIGFIYLTCMKQQGTEINIIIDDNDNDKQQDETVSAVAEAGAAGMKKN